MEDHRDALFFWQELGIREACCVHVDAHLDTSEFDIPPLSSAPQAEINCGNYLLHALRQGVVQRIVWVIPPHLCPGKLSLGWALAELGRWNFLKSSDVAAMKMVGGRVEGQLEGKPLTLCTSDRLPKLEGPCLLDIDADYYLGPADEVWETPFQLKDRLGELQLQAVTVAYSVDGGYTPVARRFLGDLTEMAYRGQEELARHYWAQLSGALAWDEELPNWMQAARLVTRASGCGLELDGPAWREAADLDKGYALHPFDLACQRWQRQDFRGARHWLDRVDWVGADYLRGLVANSEKQYAEALQCWGRLLDGQLAPEHQAHIRHLRGLARVGQGRFAESIEEFRLALQISPRQSAVWRELARAQAQMGEHEAAARSFRKAIQLAPEELASAQARVELAELYLKLGQITLLQAECQRMRASCAPGNLKLQVESLAMKALLRK